MNGCAAFSLILTLSLGLMLLPSSAYGQVPTAKIVSIHYPSIVSPSGEFEISIRAYYSDKFLVDIAIWDEKIGSILQSLTLISTFTGPGESNFTLRLSAPDSVQDWNLVATTRIWWHDAWYLDSEAGSLQFTVHVSDYSYLIVRPAALGLMLRLDGAEYKIGPTDPFNLLVRRGLHKLEAPSIIQERSGERLVFAGWSDGATASNRSILVTRNTTVLPLYRQEYYLTIICNDDNASGSGWYEAGSNATFAVTPDYVLWDWAGVVGEHYVFTRWSGDIQSVNSVDSIRMDSPKTINAVWAQEGIITSNLLAAAMLLTSIALFGAAISTKRISWKIHRKRFAARLPSTATVAIFVILMILGLSSIPAIQAESMVQRSATIVRIGDADWYYWRGASGDTCLLWLGGGIEEPGFGFLINPFEFESFGTVKFMQDLSRYYCVLALAKGSFTSANTVTNRTIYQEPYSLESTTIATVRQWLMRQGYYHTFLVGYSVGGEAAALEVAIRAPNDWTYNDGIILITVPIPGDAIARASSIHTSVLLLYGGNLPDYLSTGQQFYDKAPSEGWNGLHYFHKELHVLEAAGHEVWTIRDTGDYTTTAVNLTVSFIEASKSLQFSSIPRSLLSFTAENAEVSFMSLSAPPKVSSDEIFIITATATLQPGQNVVYYLIAYDDSFQIKSTLKLPPLGPGEAEANLVIPSLHNSTSFTPLFLRVSGNSTLLPASDRTRINILMSDLVSIGLKTNAGTVPIVFDGVQHTGSSTRTVVLSTTRGIHHLTMQPTVYASNTTRLVFVGWSDGSNSTDRVILLSTDTNLTAIYQPQYLVSVSSMYGNVRGGGWYDANSSAVISVQPPAAPAYLFVRWENGSSDSSPRTVVIVDMPKVIGANWRHIENSVHSGDLLPLESSTIVLIAVVIWSLKSSIKNKPRAQNLSSVA